jgi:non-specific serine/threonine protein kinase
MTIVSGSGSLETVGRYRIVRKLGQGGMGVVYAAHDDRLDRPVAIKRIRPGLTDGQEGQRLWREARAAASVNHPNVCQLYEIDEDAEGLFLAMELLEGEPLSARLERGPLPASDAVQSTLAVLSALAALHQKGIVHRDLKPANIFLSRHGIKLLDFGLARPVAGVVDSARSDLTLPGVLLGTPRYMPPEVIEGNAADARSDLFVVGIVLYEMLAGKPPFRGDTVFELARAIVQDEPAALDGSPGIIGLDRVIHRALRKKPDDRYQTAQAFAQDLRSALLVSNPGEMPTVRQMTRLVVLPFRLLRPDPAVDFLAFGLADAISSALSGLPSLVVRSPAAASRFGVEKPDIAALGAALDVDRVLLGTLLSSSDQVRVSVQLVQAPSGTLVRSMTSQSSIGEIFQLQDSLAKSIVDSLSLSLTAADERRINRDSPGSPEAYELYLRANQLQLDSKHWAVARDLYLQCVERDSTFAPAWARLGRCFRVLGKFGEPGEARTNLDRGVEALDRALEINPDLSLAHNLYAHVEVEAGRGREAMVRLLARVQKTTSEPELFAGLVHACRYCGLLEASAAAYDRACRLDASIVTSAAQTFLLLGDWERAIAADRTEPPFPKAMALVQLGHAAEGIGLLRDAVARGLHPQLKTVINTMIASLEGRHDQVIREVHALVDSGFTDPEGLYHFAGALAQAGDKEGALDLLERGINAGYYPASALARDPRFDAIRTAPDFAHIHRRADELQRQAFEAFRAADGPRLLGLPQM